MYFSYCNECNKRFVSASPLEYIINDKCQYCGTPLTSEKPVNQLELSRNNACGPKNRENFDNENAVNALSGYPVHLKMAL